MRQEKIIPKTNRSAYTYIGAFLGGAIISGLSTLLLAPAKGVETRKKLAERSRKFFWVKKPDMPANTQKSLNGNDRRSWKRVKKNSQENISGATPSKAIEMIHHLKNTGHH